MNDYYEVIEDQAIALAHSQVRIGWWNTSLSPLGKQRASDLDKQFVRLVVNKMMTELKLDILALGEVSSQDLIEIRESLEMPHFSLHDATTAAGKHSFDTGVFFNRKRFALLAHLSILDSYGRTTLKIGEHLALQSQEVDAQIDLVVSHWPSRMFVPEANPKRYEIGSSLRRFVEGITRGAPNPRFVVLLGDYNDDPFSGSLANHLLATRDRELAGKGNRFLYNPFWRKLGESEPFSLDSSVTSICGTYYYTSGELSRWHTFDQIIFSSTFLGPNLFSLNESLTQVLRIDELERKLLDTDEIFDHLPVVSTVEIRRPR